MSEGCQIELRLIVLAITEKDAGTELRCVTQNQAGRQEVVTHLQLEGKTIMQLFGFFFFKLYAHFSVPLMLTNRYGEIVPK